MQEPIAEIPSGMMVNLKSANKNVPRNRANNSGGKGKLQGHQTQSTLHEVACNFDYQYSIKQFQALRIISHNGYDFNNY